MRALTAAPLALIAAAALASGCGSRSELWPGVAREVEDAGVDAPPDAAACAIDPDAPAVLSGRIRDFSSSHPDFEAGVITSDPGIVERELGADGKPVYAGAANNPTTSGQAAFDQWFRDVDGINLGEDFDLPLIQATNAVGFIDTSFFPIDDALLGNEGREHNFHFTIESHTTFRHGGDEVFSFKGDDDLFVFIDGRLVLDLGGVHGPEEGSVHLGVVASVLGLEVGGVYPLDIFFAERHTSGSTYQLVLAGFELCR